MRFLFSVLSARGHLNPLIPVAQILQSRGHEVAFHSTADVGAPLAEAGIVDFLGYLETAPPAPRTDADVSRKIRGRDLESLRRAFERNLIDHTPPAVEPMRKIIRAYGPDALVVDPILYRSAIAAEREGLKWAALSCSLNPVLNPEIRSDILTVLESLDARRRELFASYGLGHIGFRGWDCLSSHLTVCFATPEFIGYAVPGVVLAGPSCPVGTRGDEPGFPWDRLLPGLPKIYLSLGSELYYQPDYINKIIDALRDEPVQLILSAGDLLKDGKLAPLPAHAIAVPYAPQLALLPHTDLFISHGGANSVMEALRFGVPLLLVPIGIDQPHQVWFVEKAGVGGELPVGRLAPGEIAVRVRAMLGDESVRGRMRKIKKSYERNGAEIAADCITDMIR